MKRIFYILIVALSILACREEIDESNRYTFTGETVADYLLNRSEEYSHMTTLLKRANVFGLLATYGQYTLFLPDNDGVEKYIYEQDSIYHATKNSEKPVWTGITSPYFEDLSDSMATVIARNHLVEGNYRTPSFEDGSLPCWNFNNRYLGITFETSPKGYSIKINNSAAIIGWDNEVENGVIQVVDKVVKETNNTLPEHIGEYDFFNLFNTALEETRFCDNLQLYMDEDFIPLEFDLRSYLESTPQKKFYKYTGFIETDEVFRENGIYTIDDLKALAEKWYGTEDRDNPCSPKNALYKFVAYHFVERELPYNKVIPLVVGEGFRQSSIDEFVTLGHDCYDYFETMFGRLMKVTKPLSTTQGADVFINYNTRELPYNIEMLDHLNVRIIPPTKFRKMRDEYAIFNPNTLNGIINPIDKILIYDENEMSGNILNERLRFDFSTLLPELSCNNIRHSKHWCYVPYYYCKNIKNNTHANDYFVYNYSDGAMMHDELIAYEMFDVSFRLPPVPPRVYEIRIAVNNMIHRWWSPYKSVIQPYIDGKPYSVIDTRPSTFDSPEIGWQSDASTFDNGLENDKQMRNLGWMKAPDSYSILVEIAANTPGYRPARESQTTLRKIITKMYLSEGEHWIRFKELNPLRDVNADLYKTKHFIFDYIELVPLKIINDPSKPEDRH